MTASQTSPDLLGTIVAATRRIVADRRARVSFAELEARAAAVPTRSGAFRAALADTTRINVIAECKRRSPSRGVLRANYDAAAIAGGYAGAGAAAISVLTEPTFFDGSLADLEAVRARVSVPLLRKDFVVDPYQILEARLAGADAILLIVSALPVAELTMLHHAAVAMGLDVLVEVHDASEVDAAERAGASIIGVNNRNLRTLEVNTATSGDVMKVLPSGAIAVAESGLRTRDELLRLRDSGYSAFLMGERFMTAADPGAALRELLAEPHGQN